MILTSTSATYTLRRHLPDLQRRNPKTILNDVTQFELTLYLAHAFKNSVCSNFSSQLSADKKSFKLTMKSDFIKPAIIVIDNLRKTLLQSYHENTTHRFDITASQPLSHDEISPPIDIQQAVAVLIQPIFKKFLKMIGADNVVKENENSFQFTWGNISKRSLDYDDLHKKRIFRTSDIVLKKLFDNSKKSLAALLKEFDITEEDIFYRVTHADILLQHYFRGGTVRGKEKIIKFPVKVFSIEPYTILIFTLDFTLPPNERYLEPLTRTLFTTPPLIPPYVPASMLPPPSHYIEPVITPPKIPRATYYNPGGE